MGIEVNFKELNPSDYPKYKNYFENNPHQLSLYTLSSILVWQNDYYQPYGDVLDDTLIIMGMFKKPELKKHLTLPMSPTKQYTPLELKNLGMALGISKFYYVTEAYLNQWQTQIDLLFHVEEQKDSEDYVYLTSDLSDLKGNKYTKKRNLINQFTKEYVTHGRVKIEGIDQSNASECIKFLEEWCEERHCDVETEVTLACEKQAVLNAINHIEVLEMSSLLLRIDNKISAMAMASYLNSQMGVLHFEKAFANIKGLYQYFDRECAKRLFQGYYYINKESDMNIQGLAHSKQSYYPIMKVKSYQLSIR
ncbi:MAG: DUF2156 domain-containing protein [Desulfobacterales bacterium]|nr:DUF2156 domain-containing protein [Desulfobacterales bacterium]